MKRKNGFTMIETMLALAILCVVGFAFAKFIVPNLTFYQRFQAHQQANFEARKCLDTIRRLLTDGKPASVRIQTPVTTPASAPNSRIDFDVVNGTYTYIILLSTGPTNTVHLLQWQAGNPLAPETDTTLATHVSALMFTLDFRDPAIINVSLQVDQPWDSSNQASNVYTVFQPNQVIRMGATQ